MEVKRNIWNTPTAKWTLILFLSGFLLLVYFFGATASADPQSLDEGRAIFEQKCKSCHTIGSGVLVGPDLQGVTDRRERAWLVRFISEPDVLIAEGDPIVTELLPEYNNVAMPNLNLSSTEVEALIAYLESGESSAPAPVELPPGDTLRGAAHFTGQRTFQNGGTPCLGCHSVGGVGAVGGGILGPDLTQVYSRLGEAGLGNSLANIAFPTMLNVYIGKPLQDQEIADLVAYFKQANNTQEAGIAQQSTGVFWIAGGVGAVLLFGVLAIFWPSQRQSLSEKLRRQR